MFSWKIRFEKNFTKWLEKWRVELTVLDFLQYWFESENLPNQELIETIIHLRDQGIACFLATKQEKYGLNFIKNEMNFKDYLDGFFSTNSLGVDKKDKIFFEKILNILPFKPVEIIFFNDDEENVKAAESLNIKSILYKSIQDIHKNLSTV